MYKILLSLLLSSSLTFGLQAQHTHIKPESGSVQTGNNKSVKPEFKTQLTAVYKASLPLKDALVAADAKQAQQAATSVKQALSQVDMQLLQGKAHTDWMSYLADMKSNLDKIESEDKLPAQRKHFSKVSEALYKSIKAFGVEGDTVYYQHCPMALDGEGAAWLSDSKQIRNPYFGEKMLTCGSTKEILN
jgi:Cu(I)/Ag(I) efflux system membrane fusion protein